MIETCAFIHTLIKICIQEIFSMAIMTYVETRAHQRKVISALASSGN